MKRKAVVVQPMYKEFQGVKVLLITYNEAKYIGTVTGFKKGKTHLSNITVLAKNGAYKAVAGGKGGITRWFNNDNIKGMTTEIPEIWLSEREYFTAMREVLEKSENLSPAFKEFMQPQVDTFFAVDTWTVNPQTLMFENLTLKQAEKLLELAKEGVFTGEAHFKHPAAKAWFAAGNFNDTQRLLTYSVVFLARAALSAALYFKNFTINP